MTIKEYLEETDKLFENLNISYVMVHDEDDETYIHEESPEYIKSFLHQRQVGLVELVKGCVPEEENKTVIGYRNPTKEVLEEVKELNLKAEGFNSCRSQFLKNLEICRTTTLPAVSPLKD